MNIEGSVALVTGANRGIGRAFTQRLLDRGATKVYAAARRPEDVDLPGVEVVTLDVTDRDQIAAVARQIGDLTLLINNAGIQRGTRLVNGDLTSLQAELDTNFWGPLELIRAFSPTLARNGGGAILNVLSAMSWFGSPGANGYHVAKAAAWAMTNGVRLELAGQGTLVTGLHLGLADTDMSARIPGDKLPPTAVADLALNGIEEDAVEVLADDWSRMIKSSLAEDPAAVYRRIQAALAGE